MALLSFETVCLGAIWHEYDTIGHRKNDRVVIVSPVFAHRHVVKIDGTSAPGWLLFTQKTLVVAKHIINVIITRVNTRLILL